MSVCFSVSTFLFFLMGKWENPLAVSLGASNWTEQTPGPDLRGFMETLWERTCLGPTTWEERRLRKKAVVEKGGKKGNKKQRQPQYFHQFGCKTNSLSVRLNFLIGTDGKDS